MVEVECPWKDCKGFHPTDYDNQQSAQLDLCNHIQNNHSNNQVTSKLVKLLFDITKRIDELSKEYDRSAAYATDNPHIHLGYRMIIDELTKLVKHS
jgi:hypothetical protein